jgi:hypothetical protein
MKVMGENLPKGISIQISPGFVTWAENRIAFYVEGTSQTRVSLLTQGCVPRLKMAHILTSISATNLLPGGHVALDGHVIATVIGVSSVVNVVLLPSFDDEGFHILRRRISSCIHAGEASAILALIAL